MSVVSATVKAHPKGTPCTVPEKKMLLKVFGDVLSRLVMNRVSLFSSFLKSPHLISSPGEQANDACIHCETKPH